MDYNSFQGCTSSGETRMDALNWVAPTVLIFDGKIHLSLKPIFASKPTFKNLNLKDRKLLKVNQQSQLFIFIQ